MQSLSNWNEIKTCHITFFCQFRFLLAAEPENAYDKKIRGKTEYGLNTKGGFNMDLPCIDLEATGRNIRSLRIANGFRVTDISTLLSLDKQAVYKWEYGKCLPQLENLFALGHLYQLKTSQLILVTSVVSKPAF